MGCLHSVSVPGDERGFPQMVMNVTMSTSATHTTLWTEGSEEGGTYSVRQAGLESPWGS